MRIVSLVGNRPQFVKAAPLCTALRAFGDEVLVHSGQHYDPELADLFFVELGIPTPDHALDVGPGTPIHQIAIMMERFEHVVRDERPDAVLVYGDTTTTLAGALVAAKCGVPLAHVGAGLRSFDKSMPEEQNRVVTDHLSDVLLCPTQQAVDNLAREGVTKGVHLVGDVMFDASRVFAPIAEGQPGPAALGLEPGGEDGYLQAFSVPLPAFDAGSSSLTFGDLHLAGADLAPLFGSAGASVSGDTAWVGYGVVDAETGRDDYAGLDVTGKIVLFP